MKFTPYIIAFLVLASCNTEFGDKNNDLKSTNPTEAQDSITLSNFDLANTVFNTGGGLGGYFIGFYEDGTFREFSFCDICPGSGTIGTYRKDSRAIYMLDSLCYSNEPHFTDSSVFEPCEGSTMTTYFLIQKGRTLYLSSNASDTIDSNDVRIDFSYPSFELSETNLVLTNFIPN